MRLWSDNPHYVEFHARPVLLVGSGEHYGALLNADFDYHPYFDTLAREGLNLVRIFSGTYREMPGEFGIQNNTLAPEHDRFISPWMKVPGGKYDLDQYNDVYFSRLHDLLSYAAQRAIVVEFSLFCFWYNPRLWEASPMHPANNIQGVGPTEKEGVYDLRNNDLLPYQEALVQKLVTALNGFDNLYLEICNEPYSRHDHTAFLDWQHHMAEIITATEESLPNQHLIAINYQNRTLQIPNKHPAVSICNFHYSLPSAVHENAHYGCVIADDETGFLGQVASPYRREAWSFMLAGGGAFSHLDYSFTVEHPEGSAPVEGSTPGYGGADLRQQLAFMRHFLEQEEVWKMKPYNEMFAWNAGQVQAQALCKPHQTYLAYFANNSPGNTQMLALPAGKYLLEWINPTLGNVFQKQIIEHHGEYYNILLPNHADDLLMKISKTS